jgi:hypothetical protein
MFNKDPNVTCAASAFVVHDEQAIVLAFRWTVGADEGAEEFSKKNFEWSRNAGVLKNPLGDKVVPILPFIRLGSRYLDISAKMSR